MCVHSLITRDRTEKIMDLFVWAQDGGGGGGGGGLVTNNNSSLFFYTLANGRGDSMNCTVCSVAGGGWWLQ